MDFLVQVSWPKGEIYKEFTVFVDPPVVDQQVVTNTPVVATTKPKPKKSVRRTTAAPVPQNDFSSLAVKGEYGPTTRNDSLWKVAEKVNKHSDVSIEQMMMALYKANPRVFYKKNVNALMEGKTLKIPQKSEIFKLSKKQAHTAFYRQMAIWEGRAVPEPVTETVSVPDSEPEIQETSDASSKLTLVSPNEDAIKQTAPLTANTVEAEGLVTENQQLQERLANLEKQFAIMQEMLAIKDQQLAAMQNVQHPQTPEALSQDKTAIPDDIEEQANPEKFIAESVSKGVPDIQPEQETNSQESKEEKVKPAKEQVQDSTDKAATEQDSGFGSYFLAFGILVALIFAWLFGRKRQTEEEINESSMFSTATEQAETDTQQKITVPVLDKKTSYDVGTVGESSFLSEFTPGDFDVFETDQAEVDPSSETDVYLAYGRYQQAEELMRQAIADQPEKDEYKLKLLEIFYASENEAGFENYANELVASGKKSDINFWSKVSGMASELIPDSALFSAAQGAATFEATDVPTDDFLNAATNIPTDDDVESVTEAMAKLSSDGNQETGSETVTVADDLQGQADSSAAVSAKADSDIESVDFDLSQFEDIIPAEVKKPGVVNDEQSIEFKISDIDARPTKEEEPQTQKPAENNDFDFDFSFDEPAVATSADSEAQDKADSEVSDLTDMDEFETKIDLAKAYIDMGDLAAAKAIAQEVLAGGSEEQKLEAQEVLKKLS